ncbi:hypothetical protein BGX28_010111 [Mortierella sp. GBA30]|nr:hypothetical protein BGX28_010111 [Mortierella sp. GBA30]
MGFWTQERSARLIEQRRRIDCSWSHLSILDVEQLNSNLPPKSQHTYFTQSGYGDQFTNINENGLIKALLRTRPDGSAEQKGALKLAFGSSMDVQSHVQLCPGKVMRRLLCGAKTSYSKGLNHISHYGMQNELDFKDEQDTFRDYVHTTTSWSTPKEEHIRTQVLMHGLVSRALKMPTEYKVADPDGCRHILTGTICRDGFEILTTGVQATIVDSTSRAIRRSVPRTANTTSAKRYLHDLHVLKQRYDIHPQEARITPLAPQQSGADQKEYWRSFRTMVEDHIRPYLFVRDQLRAFYGSKKIKTMSWDKKRVCKSESARGIQALIDALRTPCR